MGVLVLLNIFNLTGYIPALVIGLYILVGKEIVLEQVKKKDLPTVGNRHEARIQCEYCKVYLCVTLDKNCFKLYHISHNSKLNIAINTVFICFGILHLLLHIAMIYLW